jgi:hypothetical protein
MGVLLFILALETPAILALLDCTNRDPDQFPGGDADRRAWQRWLLAGVATAWILVGNGVVLAYYYSIVRRTTPS